TARLRIACCQLCVGKCSQKRQDATHNPYEHGDTHRASHLAENGARRAKDAAANDRANEEHEQVAQAQWAEELNHGVVCRAVRASRVMSSATEITNGRVELAARQT